MRKHCVRLLLVVVPLLTLLVTSRTLMAAGDFSLELVIVSPSPVFLGEQVLIEAVVRNNTPVPTEKDPVPEEVAVTYRVDGRHLATKTIRVFPQTHILSTATWVAQPITDHTIAVSIGTELVERAIKVMVPGPAQLIALVVEAVGSFFSGPQPIPISTPIVPEQAVIYADEAAHWVFICAPVAELHFHPETGLFNPDEALGLVGVFGPKAGVNGFYLLWANPDGETASVLDASGDEIGQLSATHVYGPDEVSNLPIPIPKPTELVSIVPIPIPGPTGKEPLSIWIGMVSTEGTWSGGVLLCGATPINTP